MAAAASAPMLHRWLSGCLICDVASQGYCLKADRAMIGPPTAVVICSVIYEGGVNKGQHGQGRSLLWTEVRELHVYFRHAFWLGQPALPSTASLLRCLEHLMLATYTSVLHHVGMLTSKSSSGPCLGRNARRAQSCGCRAPCPMAVWSRPSQRPRTRCWGTSWWCWRSCWQPLNS